MIASKIIRFFSTAALVVGFSTLAHAQATRTWVSGVGDDVNPCSRTAPCKTFAGAISKTAAGGEIDALDPAGFGALTITKAITLDGGGGQVASVLTSGTNGIVINAGANDKIVLRNLVISGASLNNASNGINGIRFLAGKELLLDRVVIQQFSTAGIDVAQGQNTNLVLNHVMIMQTGVGIKTTTTTGAVNGTMKDVQITDSTSHGLECISNSTLVLDNVTTSRCGGSGVRSEAASVNLSVQNSISSGNNFGYEATGGLLRLSNCGMFYNNTNLTTNVLSAGNNRSAGNTTTNTPIASGMTIN